MKIVFFLQNWKKILKMETVTKLDEESQWKEKK